MPVDPFSGTMIPGYKAIEVGVNHYTAFSLDRKTLAVVSYERDSPNHPTLHLVDLSKFMDWTVELEVTGWVTALAFSPDGARLAISTSYHDNDLLVFDVLGNTVAAHSQPDFEITRLCFTHSGHALMVYGHRLVDRFTENERADGPARVSLLNALDLSQYWSAELTGVKDGIYTVDDNASTAVHQPGNGMYFYPAVVFSPTDDVLYVIHSDEEKLTRVDFAANSFTTLTIQPKLSWFEQWLMLGTEIAHAKAASGMTRQAVISPDGTLLYTVGMKNDMHQLAYGDWELTQESLNLQGIRISDGMVVMEQDASADNIAITPAGDRLFLWSWSGDGSSGGPQMKVFDLTSASFTKGFDGAYPLPARLMDGEFVLAANDSLSESGESTRMAIYDFASGDLLGEWVSPTYASWITGP